MVEKKTPYSLGKLIDWKRIFFFVKEHITTFFICSLLAREIN